MGEKDGKRKPCWVAWDDMIKPKRWGGLGFRDIEMFNLALLARQAWRILKEPSSLSARVLKAVYYPNVDFLEAGLGVSPSRVWRAISEGKEVWHRVLSVELAREKQQIFGEQTGCPVTASSGRLVVLDQTPRSWSRS